MKICYFNGGMQVPSVRFRMPLFQQLQRRGHKCTFLNSNPSRYEYNRLLGWRCSQWLKRNVRRMHVAMVADEKFDSVILESEIFHTEDYSLEQKLRAASGRLIYDIDDAIFLLFPEKTQAIASMADRVIAGNQRIADWALQYNDCVTVIPTCVDLNRYTAKNYNVSSTTDVPVVGWIGSRGNVGMLSVCAPALRQLATHKNFELHLITSHQQALAEVDLNGVNVRWININRSNTVAELQRLDIGLMPLPDDDPWMQYKCNAKLIQYMAVGLPAVASAIGFNVDVVRHGENGMLAVDRDQWVTCLTDLLDSRELRQSLGKAARETVLQSFTVQGRVEEYERALLGAKFQPEKGRWRLEP